MKKKALVDTNPYLKDRSKREAAILRGVVSSSAIEGIDPKKLYHYLANIKERKS